MLLAAHNDDNLCDNMVDTGDLDTNTSTFDRINLGSFYEEHQRQREMLVDNDEWNRRRSPTRKHGVRRSPRCGYLTSWRHTGSLPDITMGDIGCDKDQMVFISTTLIYTLDLVPSGLELQYY